jgi:fructose-1,6-bisphosphatase/inositol monophosphatase family enzyme
VPRGKRIGVVNYQLGRQDREQIDRLLDLWTRDDPPVGKLLALGGSVAYGLALVAKGAHDALVTVMGHEPDPWDLTPGALLVRNAGGKVTDLYGKDIDPLSFEGYLVASTHPGDHERMLELLSECGFPARRE